MWKKDDAPETPFSPPPEPAPTPMRAAPAPAGVGATTGAPSVRATIGSSITIRGEVTGDEDLLIEGRVDGSVDLKQHSVTVGRAGEVKANVSGRVIVVEGRVEGNLRADEQVLLRSSAVVQGDLAAPRVVLEDGARFRGGVDMGETPQPNGAARPVAGKEPQAGRKSAVDGSSPTDTVAPAGSAMSASSDKPVDAAHKPAEVAR